MNTLHGETETQSEKSHPARGNRNTVREITPCMGKHNQVREITPCMGKQKHSQRNHTLHGKTDTQPEKSHPAWETNTNTTKSEKSHPAWGNRYTAREITPCMGKQAQNRVREINRSIQPFRVSKADSAHMCMNPHKQIGSAHKSVRIARYHTHCSCLLPVFIN